MQPKRIDHVAFWVADRDAIADALLYRLPWHVVDRQDNFTLLGGDARGFKLTLFDAEELGIEVDSVVDAANTYAAFLRGPDGVRIEYVEHKPTFSLR